ncbi:cation-translocating P-type ATPase [Flavitalea sp. BT771]|uniref:heavy metal translocating P-type ATPase n=1 Tax=Flavitalea sp. BT771 TaxID=3063329 RepID=UPI0026E2ADE7|nr:cation-translocating P-type ATPase [Flavitalea sp. BT771]MDO6433944.1 cation-translocating P-type ATPase [Flavitalea sp. BT771]MDV6222845.1 cation-translocating P-type ATPase [Flavitalea sp. BT771]
MSKGVINRHLRYLFICLPFTAILFVQEMGAGMVWLTNPWIQLAICLPVYITGMHFFGRSALKSIRKGKPNMNVLIAVGASAAFLYSLSGTWMGLGADYVFYETAAAIITFVFLGYYLEDVAVRSTQKALDGLVRSEKTMANMVAYDDEQQEMVFPVEGDQLRSGDLILIRSGERVPADAKILWGEASVDESILTGESLPLDKRSKDFLVGGSILVAGTVRAQVTADAGDSVLAGIVRMVREAQGEKAPVQRLADRISAVFVPVVLGLAVAAFGLNYFFLHALTPALMRAIAVLVIACPCAMGLATPAAIAVGLGRAARQGILFRRASGLEAFKGVRQVIFDKTGTLTTGEFAIVGWQVAPAGGHAPERDRMEAGGTGSGVGPTPVSPEEFRRIAFSLEKYSAHPIARGITRAWRVKNDQRWRKIEEIRGVGMRAETKEGDVYIAGSYKVAAGLTREEGHSVYIVRNGQLLGWIDVEDTLRAEAAAVLQWLRVKGFRTVLLSGDKEDRCARVASQLGVDEVFAQQTPEQKVAVVSRLSAEAPTAMVGDGINDAPALAAATIGISMSDAAQLALQTADVVLMGHGLRRLPAALELGRHTFTTIRQNLFWAFFYNIVAIPVAGLGLLTPAVAALAMGFSDVVLVLNSLRLFVRKVK